ncbi:odorant receptor 131-2-like [Corythoichthys intestinalis]|uniref:odorant receptor 131-2-like n=1 Tax=Corythoichthys intestinalis TaxID=161448 RepID=UPI0025A54361|nr:odorant receptor 131-2-like [Corythoichthys intestinalis]
MASTALVVFFLALMEACLRGWHTATSLFRDITTSIRGDSRLYSLLSIASTPHTGNMRVMQQALSRYISWVMASCNVSPGMQTGEKGISQVNITTGLSLAERIMSATLTTSFCWILLLLNGIMLFTLRNKCIFRETSRYILLYNLLLGDTLQMVFSQLMYCLTSFRITLLYPVCGVLVLFGNLFSRISPLVLVAMSLERYVAVCHPLRHASIMTRENTVRLMLGMWIVCFIILLIQDLIILRFPFEQLESLQMTQQCHSITMSLLPLTEIFKNTYSVLVFFAAGLANISSYIGIVIAARSAATDKVSARKAKSTLLLHLVQLSLSLLSVIYSNIVIILSPLLNWVAFNQMQIFLFVCFFLLPRSLSSLVYGLRDQSLRIALLYLLFFCFKGSVKAAVS